MAPPFDLNWTPALENKISTQIDGQLPDFIAEDHPKFSQFLKSYYQFLEAGELQLTVNIDNILMEVDTATNILNEDGTLIVTEVGTGSTGKFVDGETITGGTSYSTATVLVEDLGHTTPRMFISSQQLFQTGETVTGGTSGASGTVTRYRANPVQNIQQLLAYADIDNTIYDFIEEFRKSFMEGIPSNLANGINKRNLEKHIRELYRRKGTKEGAKLFMKILLDETSDIFYPNQYMMKASDADWDKPTIIRCASSGAAVARELIGQSVTGRTSAATALVENSTTFAAAGGISYVEFELSSIVGTFEVGETLYGLSSVEDVQYDFIVKQINTTVTITNDGTLYQVGDAIDVDTAVSIGSGDIAATVGDVQVGSVSDVIIDDVGTNYELGDLVVFTNHASDAGLINAATGLVTVINGNILDETDGDIILQEEGTNSFIDLFNFQVEEATVREEVPYTVFGTDTVYAATQGYYYPIYLTNYAAEQTTITKAKASVNGATFASTTVALDGNAGGSLAIGMSVKSNSIADDAAVTITSVTDQTSIVISSAQTLLDNEVLVFESAPTAVRQYTFIEYPGVTFYSPTATTETAQASYNSSTYTLYGGNYNHRADHLYAESGNAASYADGINTEPVLGSRFESEWDVNLITIDSNRYDNEGFILESGDGDITKITVTNGGEGYQRLPSVAIRSQYGANAKALAVSTEIGRLDSVNVTNPGFDYSESPSLELRANFVIKDLVNSFVEGEALTSHTGTFRSYDATNQVATVTLNDVVGIAGESDGLTYNEGVLLEDNLASWAYVDSNIIMDNDLEYGDTLVDESGNRILVDGESSRTDVLVSEDGNDVIIMEPPAEFRSSFFTLESGTAGFGFLLEEENAGHLEQELTSNDPFTLFDWEWGTPPTKFVLESSRPDIVTSAGDFILLDSNLTSGDILFDGTDANGTDAGDKVYLNATDSSGTNDPTNNIVIEAGYPNDVNERLVHETEIAYSIDLDGINSDGLHGTERLLLEEAGIDFSAGTTTLSTASASATIVHGDVAKASFDLGTTVEKRGRYGGIESLISEELIRIQDSYYYQDFAYEVQTNSSGSVYLNELKKAVHPAGFNVFSKVINATSVSAAIGTAGASLGTNDYDASTYSAILASTFTTLFSETVQRRLGVQSDDAFDVLLETSVVQRDGDKFILEEEVGVGILQMETPENSYPDFEAIAITHGTDAGEIGVLITEADDRIVSERAEAITNNIVIDGTEEGHLLTSQVDAGSNLILEDDSGDPLAIEDGSIDGISFLLGEDIATDDNLLDETDGENFILEGTTTTDVEVFLRTNIVNKISATVNKTHNTSNGLTFLATTSNNSITGTGIQLESFAGQLGSTLLITGTADMDSEGNVQQDAGSDVVVEEDGDVNFGQSVTIDTFTSIANDNLVQDTAANENDNLILENPVGFHGGGALLAEDSNPESYTIQDFVRETLVLFPNENDGHIDDGIILENQEVGTFKQEDGTTVSTTFGDDLLLEDNTGFGVAGKISFENSFVVVEDSLETGQTPFGATGNTTLASFTRPSDIFVSIMGRLMLEDIDQGDNIVYDTAIDAGDEILLEDGTEENFLFARKEDYLANETGWSGATKFDTILLDFSAEKIR